jgi:hypothetical protein
MRALTIKERHGQPDDSVEEVVVKLAGGTDCIQSPLQRAGQHNQRAQQSHHSVTCSSHTTTQHSGMSAHNTVSDDILLEAAISVLPIS